MTQHTIHPVLCRDVKLMLLHLPTSQHCTTQVKVAEFNVIKAQLSAAARKAGGSLAVRDVAAMVKPEQVVDSEHLSTLFVVVSKFSVKDWEGSYEKLCDFVVPRSTRLVTEDADYALFSVVLFKRVVDDFKAAARTRGFQVGEVYGLTVQVGVCGSLREKLCEAVNWRRGGQGW